MILNYIYKSNFKWCRQFEREVDEKSNLLEIEIKMESLPPKYVM